MKKILEYLYIFSKLSTSLILLLSILVIGYFFYVSFNKQDKLNSNRLELTNKINQNSEILTKFSNKLKITDSTLDDMKQILTNNTNNSNSDEIANLNKQIGELNLKLENLSESLKETETLAVPKVSEIPINNSSNLVLEKNKTELAKLVIFKFENNLDFNEEMKILQNLNDIKKQHIFEKINLIKLKNFRGSIFLKNTFSNESDIFLKQKIKNSSNNIITKSLMKFIVLEPSQKNIIIDNEINILNEISSSLLQKKYNISYQKIMTIDKHEKYFKESINQLKIVIAFKEQIKKID